MAPTPNAVRSARSLAALHEAAVAAFAERGFHATSIRDLAARSGMSSAALYVHHSTKEELLLAISRTGHAAALAAVEDGRASSDDPTERLQCLVANYVRFHAEQASLARVINYEMGALEPASRAEIEGVRQQIHEVVLDVLRDGVARGAFACPSVELSAVMIESLGIDVARWYDAGRSWTPDDLAQRYADSVVRLVEPPRP